MSNAVSTDVGRDAPRAVRGGLAKRRQAEKRFRFLALAAIVISLAFLALLFASIVTNGYTAFEQTAIRLSVFLDPQVFNQVAMENADYAGLIKAALRHRFPAVKKRRAKRLLYKLMSPGAAWQLREEVLHRCDLIGKTLDVWLPADDDVDMLIKGRIDRHLPESTRRLCDLQIRWIEMLEKDGAVKKRFNWAFFSGADSREPELSGILGATVGSLLTLIVTLLLSFPVGVATAVYLEEFAPKNGWTDFIEVNINNLAAVPSIVFGLLGLGVFINFFGLPRSSSLVGGLVLTLMTLPTIIIAARSALQSVPPSIREAALAMGASKMQAVTHHIFPLALPGVLTGTIIGMARALGETAPLLMVGMVAFIADIPKSFTDPAPVLPVQIYLWADSPERAFVERTSAAIMVLLVFLILMNAGAIYLRKRFEKQW